MVHAARAAREVGFACHRAEEDTDSPCVSISCWSSGGSSPAREQARRAVMAGTVAGRGPAGRQARHGGARDGRALALAVPNEPFVSRAGRKLADALDHFGVDPGRASSAWTWAPRRAASPTASSSAARRASMPLDVGYGQLDQKLRIDPRVVVMERVNARHLAPDALPEPLRLITSTSPSSRSLKVVPALLAAPGARRPPAAHDQAAVRGRPRRRWARGASCATRRCAGGSSASAPAAGGAWGLELVGLFDSPVAGVGGNREAFALLRHGEGGR